MAIKVRHQGTWKDVHGVHVRDGNEWKPVKHLFVMVENKIDPLDPSSWTKTWKLIRSFVPPHRAPPDPILTPYYGNGFPKAHLDFGYFSPHEVVEQTWTIEIYIHVWGGGDPYLYEPDEYENDPVPDLTIGEIILPWREPQATIQVRTRYVNEAGPGPWSALSAPVTVFPD